MTVKELVAKLSLVPQDAVVEIYDEEMPGDPWFDVVSVTYVDKEQFDDPDDPSHRDHSVIRIS